MLMLRGIAPVIEISPLSSLSNYRSSSWFILWRILDSRAFHLIQGDRGMGHVPKFIGMTTRFNRSIKFIYISMLLRDSTTSNIVQRQLRSFERSLTSLTWTKMVKGGIGSAATIMVLPSGNPWQSQEDKLARVMAANGMARPCSCPEQRACCRVSSHLKEYWPCHAKTNSPQLPPSGSISVKTLST